MFPIDFCHIPVSIIKRSAGRSAVAAAAYRSGTKLTNEWDGMTHDYTRKGGIVHAEIMLPAHAPPEFADRSILWNSVEQIEKARDSQLAREIEAALPRELSGEQQLALVRAYVKDNFVDKGMCADFAIHDKGTGNPHVHMKKKLPIILLGVILACVLVFGFLYANNDIGKTANSLEADIRQSQKILDDWIVDGSISDTMAAFISYPQDKTDHTFSVYVNRPGLSFGYFFRGGGDIVEVDDYIAEFVVEGNNERAFISMNTQNIVRLEVDDGNGIQVIDIDSGKPFAIVLPLNVGNICFYDTNGNVVEYLRQQL